MGNQQAKELTEHDLIHQRNLDRFNSGSNNIPVRFRRTIERMLAVDNPLKDQLKVWISLTRTLTLLDIHAFVVVYQIISQSDSLSPFLDDLAQFIELYHSKIQYAPSTVSLSQLLVSSTQYEPPLSFDQDLNNIQRITPKVNDMSRWFISNTLIQSLASVAFNSIFLSISPPQLPVILSASQFITKEALFTLNANIQSRQKQWRLAYSSERDGHAWSAFNARVCNCGAVLLLLRDTNGHVFGAYTSKPLLKASKFQADDSSFLISLLPQLAIYRQTGQNANHVYFNQQTQSFPNGIGFGGQLDYFGLWIDAGFIKGHTRGNPCSTYGNAPLTTEEFEIESVEVWCVEELEIDERLVASITMNAEAKALLEMSGRVMWSDAERK